MSGCGIPGCDIHRLHLHAEDGYVQFTTAGTLPTHESDCNCHICLQAQVAELERQLRDAVNVLHDDEDCGKLIDKLEAENAGLRQTIQRMREEFHFCMKHAGGLNECLDGFCVDYREALEGK